MLESIYSYEKSSKTQLPQSFGATDSGFSIIQRGNLEKEVSIASQL